MFQVNMVFSLNFPGVPSGHVSPDGDAHAWHVSPQCGGSAGRGLAGRGQRCKSLGSGGLCAWGGWPPGRRGQPAALAGPSNSEAWMWVSLGFLTFHADLPQVPHVHDERTRVHPNPQGAAREGQGGRAHKVHAPGLEQSRPRPHALWKRSGEQ